MPVKMSRGPCQVLQRQDKFFRLQIGNRVDVVSVDRLNPVISDSVPAKSLARGSETRLHRLE